MHPSTSDTTTCEEDNSIMVAEITLITIHTELDDYLETPCVPKKTNPVNFLEG